MKKFLVLTILYVNLIVNSVFCEEEEVVSAEVCVDGSTSSECSANQGDVKVVSSNNDDDNNDKTELTLGQKLLAKQEFYATKDKSSQHYAHTGSTAIGVRIYNPNKIVYDMYWYDTYRKQGIYKGKVRASHLQTTNSYIGHIFYITPRNEPENEIFRIVIEKGKNMYVIPPDFENNNVDENFYNTILERQKFFAEYENKNGIPWLAYYPRNPPILHMWNADYIGQTHTITSNEYYWICEPDNPNDPEEVERCQPKIPVNITIEVISVKPKIFAIENTISDTEADIVVSLSDPKMARSRAGTDGGYVTETRTSETSWLDRTEHYIVETIYRRAGDILKVDESLLKNSKNAESLQVVHYLPGQEYKAHHDFGDNGRPESRYITLLYYLNEQANEYAGGETVFPKANNGKGLLAHPGKGNSVLFYNLLEDGNGDDLTLHEARAVKQGEKWICNFWVWDPSR